MYDVVIASEDLCAARALRDTISPYGDLRITGEVTAIGDIPHSIEVLKPDVLVLNTAQFDESVFDAIAQTKFVLNPPGILAISIRCEASLMSRVLNAGVLGFVLSRDDPELIPYAIRAVAVGLPCTSPTTRQQLLDHFQEPASPPIAEVSFTTQEKHVLKCFGQGNGVQQTATAMDVSERTIRHHMDNIRAKTGLISREEIIVYAVKHGFDREMSDE